MHQNKISEWGDSSDDFAVLDKKLAHERYNRRLDIIISLVYFGIIIALYIWNTEKAKDILSLITPVVFYLLGIHSRKDKT